MSNSRTTPSLFAVAIAIALAIGGALAPNSEGRAVAKAGAPTLTIEAKRCLIGPTEEDRSVTVTALALLGATGERVTMRFSVQSRQGKTRWKRLLFKDPENSGKWETTEAAGAGLKLTKTIPKLPENFDYRVVVEARAVDASGKVITKTARKYVPCKQPMFTPTLSIGKVQIAKQVPSSIERPTPVPVAAAPGQPVVSETVGDTPPYLVIPVKNLGRLPSAAVELTVAKADTREVIGRYDASALKGSANTRLVINLPAGCSQLYLTVQLKDAAPEQLAPAQATVIDCRAEPARALSKRRLR